MSLKNQPGFVTIGVDNNNRDSGEEVSVAEPADKVTPPPTEEKLQSACLTAAVSSQNEAEPDANRLGFVERDNCISGSTDELDRTSSNVVSTSDSVDMDLYEDEGGLLSKPDFSQSAPVWMASCREQSINELHDYFSQFYSIRSIVRLTYHEFKNACQEIQDLLAASSMASSISDTLSERGTEAWLSASEEQTIMSVLGADPVLMVLGCKGSGKSSVVNGILGADILPSSSAMLKHACNGIVYLKYDEVGYVRVARSSTEVSLQSIPQQQQQQQPQQEGGGACQRPSHLVREFIEDVMSDEERASWGSLDSSLEIGINNPILRTRVQFLEIPGDCFDPRLRDRLLRQLLRCNHQTVLYVIDGNKGLGNSDREFLFFLRANMPNMHIFFIINKVDYDPEAEEMDCESDNEDADASGERYHNTGVQTQKRKQKLVTDQLEKYKLASSSSSSGKQSVFPVSMLRQRCALEEGQSEQIKLLNQEYKANYQHMVTALKDCLVETGQSRMKLALSTLFLVAVRTFDAFTRDPSVDAGEGARQAEQATKELIQQSFCQTKAKFKECRATFLRDLGETHKRMEPSIVEACQRLEFGPLRLYSRIRNNEVEQQYREQINNYVLHLLNIEIRESLERRIEDIKKVLFNEVEKLKLMFSKTSPDRPSSPWDDFIRTHADEVIMGIVKLNFSVEWKAEAGFLKWIKKLWCDARAANKSKTVCPNTPEWKREIAREFYASIDLNVVVRKMFASVDFTLKQAESGLLNLVNSRHTFAAKLQKMLARDNQVAQAVWHRVQFCLVSAEGLRNLLEHGALASSFLTDPVAHTSLGRICNLTHGYANFLPTKDSSVAVTVTRIGSGAASDPASNWLGSLGGIPNHHLMKGQLVLKQRCVAITLMVTFTDKGELCVLHSAYRCPLKDHIEGTTGEKYSKVQCFQMIKDLMHIWRMFEQEKAPLQWSLKLDRLKSSRTDGASVVYDFLENPVSTLKKETTAKERSGNELNNLLQVAFMLLIRSVREFHPEELSRIDERESLDERHKEFKRYLTSLTAGLTPASLREFENFPVDTIANLWYTMKPDIKVKDIEEWINRNLQKALNCPK